MRHTEWNAEVLVRAIEVARRFTGRSKVFNLDSGAPALFLAGDVEEVAPLNPSLLCHAIAASERRIAAIVVGPVASAHPLILKRFLKRVRELASAEGALMIWVETSSPEELSHQDLGIVPDLICRRRYEEPVQAWLTGRADIPLGRAL